MNPRFLVALVISGILSLVRPVYAYQVDTHGAISEKAADVSNLTERLKDIGPDLGLLSLDSPLSDGGIYFFGFSVFEKSQPIRKWIREGSIKEDSYYGARFFNHFYNPLAPAGQEGYLGTAYPSLRWGLEPTDIFLQDYSYRDARNYYYQGLVAASESERKRNLALTFRSVGQVIHLVQDLAQPQHTHNDSHGLGSRYEKYTNTAKVLSGLTFGGYPSVTLNTPDQFWVTPDGKGLANYSNRGFVTDGANFTGTRTGNALNIQPNPNFPSPNGAGAVILKQQITDPDLLGPNGPSQPLQGEMWFVGTTVPDNYLGTTTDTNPKTSTFSIFDEDLTAIGSDWTFTLNNYNYKEAHKLLIPRAVGYSAGLINYFFRGTMEITPPAEQVYAIVDHSQIHQTDPMAGYAGFGAIKLNVRNTTPSGEAMTGGKLIAVAKFHRNGCYKDDLSGEFSQDTAGNLVYPVCASGQVYRTPDEEILVSTSVKDAAGNLLTTVSLDAVTPTQLTFNFANAIPINATDLYLQVVYRGTLGNEPDAVAVATKDVFEPTYVAVLNSTDQLLFNGTFYATTDLALLPTLDGNHDGVLDSQFQPTKLNVYFGFKSDFTGQPIGYVIDLPPARYSRLALLTDRSPFTAPIQAFSVQRGSTFDSLGIYSLGAETNQLDPTSGIYRVAALQKLRGVPRWDVLTLYSYYGAPSTGDLNTLPALTDKTPYPVTSLTFP